MEIPYTVKARPDTGLWNAKLGIWLFLASEVMLFGGLFSAYIFLRLGAEYWPHHVLDVPMGLTNTAILITSSITMVFAWAALKFRDFGKFRLWMGITLVCASCFLVIKSFEYKSKFEHYGFIIKPAHAELYLPKLEAMGAKIGHFRSTGAIEVTGYLKSEVSEETDFFLVKPDPAPQLSLSDGIALRGLDSNLQDGIGGKTSDLEPIQIERDHVDWWGNFAPRYSSFFGIYYVLTGLHALHVIGGMVVLGYFWLTGYGMFKRDPEHLTNRVEVGGLFWHFVDLVWIFLFPVLYLL
ncbi:MAG: heme-copper oxidase subunit III [Verrucomicrobiales bacterium]